jgi:hypothetical protein
MQQIAVEWVNGVIRSLVQKKRCVKGMAERQGCLY